MPCTSEASKDTEAPRSSSPDHRDPDYWAKVADKEIHTDIQTYRHTDIQTYRHTYIHTYICTYMHAKESKKNKGEGRQTTLDQFWNKAGEKDKGGGSESKSD
jgi:hypothetical protein